MSCGDVRIAALDAVPFSCRLAYPTDSVDTELPAPIRVGVADVLLAVDDNCAVPLFRAQRRLSACSVICGFEGVPA
jgi:hypothetical protein